MDYDKYEEAKRLYKTANADQRYVLESLFPELREFDNERIRKALLNMIHDTADYDLWVDYDVHKDDAIAWLEKQKAINDTDEDIVEASRDASVLDMIEPKSDWGEEDEKMLNSIIEDFGDGKTSNMLQEYWLKSLKQRIGG